MGLWRENCPAKELHRILADGKLAERKWKHSEGPLKWAMSRTAEYVAMEELPPQGTDGRGVVQTVVSGGRCKSLPARGPVQPFLFLRGLHSKVWNTTHFMAVISGDNDDIWEVGE